VALTDVNYNVSDCGELQWRWVKKLQCDELQRTTMAVRTTMTFQ